MILSLGLLIVVPFLTGCQNKDSDKEKAEVINPFSAGSMADTYQDSKERINNTVEKQNENINKAIEDSGINE